jgi:GMP synthase (glutamine-hydrolysing)
MGPYTDFGSEFVEKHTDKVDAVVLSGTEALLSKDSVQSAFRDTIKAVRLLNLPVLGICGGHQLIALAYGEKVLYMRQDLEGYREVEVLVEDPLFHELPATISVTESHEEMVDHVPRGFTLLARSPETPIEAIRSESDILYGVQFHPEFNDENHPAGKLILANFAKIVKR